MGARKFGRFLAPLALLAVIGAAVVIIEKQTHHGHPAGARSGTTATTGTTTTASPGKHSRPAPAKPRFYIVKPGDNLSSIAVREHVPLATIEALNPGLDPGTLQTGQRLRLRR